MTSLRSRPKPLPKPCPVCDDKRHTAEAVTAHNIQASQTGCRVYQGRAA